MIDALTTCFLFGPSRSPGGREVRLRQFDIGCATIEGQLGEPYCQPVLLGVIPRGAIRQTIEKCRARLLGAGIRSTQRRTRVQIKNTFAFGDLGFADRRIQARNLDFQIALESKSRGFTQGEGHFALLRLGCRSRHKSMAEHTAPYEHEHDLERCCPSG